MANTHRQEALAWVRAYMDANPGVSVHDIAREASRTGNDLDIGTITELRKVRLRVPVGAVPPILVPAPPGVAGKPAPKCTRCGAVGHWISQCVDLDRLADTTRTELAAFVARDPATGQRSFSELCRHVRASGFADATEDQVAEALEAYYAVAHMSVSMELPTQKLPDGAVNVSVDLDKVPAVIRGDAFQYARRKVNAARRGDVGLADPIALATEREQKAKRDAERAADQAARQAEREATWAAERAAEAVRAQQESEVMAERDRVADPASLPELVGASFASKLDSAQRTEESPAGPSAQLPPEMQEGARRTVDGAAIRTRWVEDLLLQRPGLTSTDVQAAMRAFFGIGLDNEVVTSIMQEVRELNGMRFITRSRRPLEVPKKVPPAGTAPRLVEFLVNGEVHYVATTVAQLGATLERLGAEHGIDPRAAQVWRPATTKVKVVVQLEEED